MQTSLKKRLEIIIEMPAVPRLESVLRKAGVKGWTVLPAKSGQGRNGNWAREGQITEAGRMVMVLTVIDPAVLDTVLDSVYALLERQIGIVMVSDVQVVRGDRF
ncbi:MAG: P-II family nitrogen regulator [Caulobacterales bacterium]|uniref:P-II family nitrogen regulator n=1 Tax=Glycocaulis sp. TaxID=1969725 RepID=UPI003FA01424